MAFGVTFGLPSGGRKVCAKIGACAFGWPQGLCQNGCLCVWMAAKCVPSLATVALGVQVVA